MPPGHVLNFFSERFTWAIRAVYTRRARGVVMSDDFAVGQRIGDYEILGPLGAGGMGKVYKVRNVISDRVEAMKVLLANLAGQKELADRFLREIKLLASMDDPNIAQLRTALTVDNQLMMIMEYVEGTTLAARLQQGPIPPADAVNYSEQLLHALSYAHHMGVIHRDIKPSNVMLTPHGIVKLMDFGIARPSDDAGMTVTGTTLGSLNYMSPEQVRGEAVDPRSDLYAMGVSLYEMVTGQLPFRGNSNYSVMAAHLQDAPAPPISLSPNLPGGLNEIILMAMAKKPQDRFQSAEAFRNALKSVMPGVEVPVTRPAAQVASVPMAASTAAPSPQAFQPAPANPAVARSTQVADAGVQSHPTPPPSSHRGVYMALGGLLVVAMLAAAAFYLPRHASTQASPDSTNSSLPVQASPQPDAAPTTPAATAPVVSAPPPAASPAPPSKDDSAAAQEKLAAAQAAQDAADEAAKAQAAALADAEQEADQINARATSVSASLDTLRRAQNAQGYGLRGDITEAEELMKTDISRGQAAIEQKDPDNAKKYLDMADAQVEKIERFLGR